MRNNPSQARGVILLVTLAVACALAGCQDYFSTTVTTGPAGNSPNIVLNPPGTIPVDQGKSVNVTATVAGDTSGDGVTWRLNGIGTLSNVTTTSVTYNAPANSAGTNVTLGATEVIDPSQFTSTIISIEQFPSFVTTSLPNGTDGVGYNALITVANGSPPFAWSLVSGSLPPGIAFSVGSLNSLELSGTPITCTNGQSAPACTPPGTYTFTFQVSDATGGTAKQQLSITIAASSGSTLRAKLLKNPAAAALAADSSDDALLAGDYAFLFNGVQAGCALATAGVLSADGAGNITAGSADRNGVLGPQMGMGFSGSYNLGANHLGLMLLDFADGSSAAYALAVTSEGQVRSIEFDDVDGSGARGSGQMARQDPSALRASLAGSYALALNGLDAQAQPLALIGTFDADQSGAISQGRLQAADSQSSVASGTLVGALHVGLAGSESFGLSLVAALEFAPKSLSFKFYPVSPAAWFALETDAGSSPLLAGVLKRGEPTEGVFGGASARVNLSSGESLLLQATGRPQARLVSAPSAGPFSAATWVGVFAGASDLASGFAGPQVVLALGFDGHGNVTLEGASSSAQGLQSISRQAGSYNVAADVMNFEGITVQAMPLQALIHSSSEVSLVEPDVSPPLQILIHK